MANFTVVNSTSADLEDVNAADDDVPARSICSPVTLDAAEALVLVAIPGVAVLDDATTYQHRRNIAKMLKYRKIVAPVAE